jgi:hypothetical protein
LVEQTLLYIYNLHYKCEVTKLGTAATGNFLSGKRERLYATLPNKQDFRVAEKVLKFIKVGGGGQSGGLHVQGTVSHN